ncbi:MAG: amino acid permease [Candidatus Neomarinimicrobiota bacterium]|nr:amino acid permease [Candidatus Neomarinimicrobiota bacterium]
MSNSRRVLGIFDATSMVTGNMIGSGIFLLVGFAAQPVTSDFSLILAWIGGGLMALMGAFCIAELSTRFPQTGGDFIYLHKVYGPFPSFLYGWMSLVIFQTGATAVLALFSAKYTLQFLPQLQFLSVSGLASLILIFLTAIHCFKVQVGSRFQSILTIIKVVGIFLMVGLLFQLKPIEAFQSYSNNSADNPYIGFSRALTPIFFAYTGWNCAGYIAGEISNPRRTLPFALIGGTLITMIIYAIVNYSFIQSIGLESMKGQEMVPLLALNAVGASHWSGFLSLLILISVMSSLSIHIQTAAARVIQAMGQQGIFFKFTGKINPRFYTPINALTVQAIWTIGLMFLLNIENLVDSTTVVMIMFSALSISTLFKVERKKNDSKIFTIPLYPLIPLAYILSAVFICWGVIQFHLSQNSYLPFWGLFFLLAGSLIYFSWKNYFLNE